MSEEYTADIAVEVERIADVLSTLTSAPSWEVLIDANFFELPVSRYLKVLFSREEGVLLAKYGVREPHQHIPDWTKEVFVVEKQTGLSLKSLAVLQAADIHNKWLSECQEQLDQLDAEDLDDLPY